MIRKVRSYCDQNLQFVAISQNKLKTFTFIFFNFDPPFFQNIFDCNIPFGFGLPLISNLLYSFQCSKSYNGPQKISAMNKKEIALLVKFYCL